MSELLQDKASVLRIPGNGSSTSHGLAKLKSWLGDGRWDVIHFNFGLHDAKLSSENIPLSEPGVYATNLRELVKQLKATGAKLIWASTTPVPNGGNLAPDRKFGDVNAYNAIAKKVMEENTVTINDLNAAVQPEVVKLQKPGDVHFTKQGSEFLARLVAASIEARIPKP